MLVTLFIVALKAWPPTHARSARADWGEWLWGGGGRKKVGDLPQTWSQCSDCAYVPEPRGRLELGRIWRQQSLTLGQCCHSVGSFYPWGKRGRSRL